MRASSVPNHPSTDIRLLRLTWYTSPAAILSRTAATDSRYAAASRLQRAGPQPSGAPPFFSLPSSPGFVARGCGSTRTTPLGNAPSAGRTGRPPASSAHASYPSHPIPHGASPPTDRCGHSSRKAAVRSGQRAVSNLPSSRTQWRLRPTSRREDCQPPRHDPHAGPRSSAHGTDRTGRCSVRAANRPQAPECRGSSLCPPAPRRCPRRRSADGSGACRKRPISRRPSAPPG